MVIARGRLWLLDNTAGESSAAAAQLHGMVGVVIAPLVQHQCVPFDLAQLVQARCEHGVRGSAILGNIQCRQVSKMPISPWRAVLSRAIGIEVRARSASRRHLAILLGGIAARLLVHMKTMQSWLQSLDIGCENQSVFAF